METSSPPPSAALQAGDVDLVLTDSAAGKAIAEASGDGLEDDGRAAAGGGLRPTSSPKGSDLVAPINAGIATLKADGTLDGLTKSGSSTTP